jgi:hypothetical protein
LLIGHVAKLECVVSDAVQSTTNAKNILSIGIVLPAGVSSILCLPGAHGAGGQETLAILGGDVVAGAIMLRVKPIDAKTGRIQEQ